MNGLTWDRSCEEPFARRRSGLVASTLPILLMSSVFFLSDISVISRFFE
jgi:hypothetical protein